jgi:glutaredoxin 3
MLLDHKGVSFNEISVDHDPTKRTEMMERSGRRTVPQIFIGEHHVGGCDDLFALERNGELDELLANNAGE